MITKFVKSSLKREILSKIEEDYGVNKFDFLLVEPGNKKIRGFSGTMSKEEIDEISKLTNIETIGLYLFKKDDFGWHLSLDATNVFSSQISKRIVEVTKEQLDLWLRGEDLEIEEEKGYVIIKYEDDLFGCGRSSGKRISNGVPKERRIKN